VTPSPAATRTIVLDFDGTITEDDLLDRIAREFGDPAVYQEVEDGLHAGTVTLQECITREYEPVTMPMADAVAWVLEQVRIRPGLPELVDLARERGWEVKVLSSGFEELIRPVLAQAGVAGVDVVANTVDVTPDGWRVRWHEQTICATCGQACKRGGLPADGEVVYIGDGISDRCAAQAADRVFATRGLARYFDEHGLPYEPFDDFHDVVRALRG
jgi:2-hydroxy-3-keto-5-methylthiopentenyl-1-phosphate phosphatase